MVASKKVSRETLSKHKQKNKGAKNGKDFGDQPITQRKSQSKLSLKNTDMPQLGRHKGELSVGEKVSYIFDLL